MARLASLDSSRVAVRTDLILNAAVVTQNFRGGISGIMSPIQVDPVHQKK